jgi:RNA polymerase sigma-70 factor (ECF subfamily)
VTDHARLMHEPDTLLVQRAVQGDERAMRMLWAQHAPHVDAVVRRLAGDPDTAADVAQEVWIQIFKALPSWRGDSRFSTWIHRIAINRALNALRSVRRRQKVESPIDEVELTVEHEGDRALLAASIAEAAEQLAPGARTVFLLHDVEGLTHEEIAEQLGISAGGSKSQLFKARAKLRRLLAPLVDRSPRDASRLGEDGPSFGSASYATP